MSIQTNILPDNPQIEVIKSGKTGLFTNYIYKAIPLAFDESMSYYETLCGLLHYLKFTIIPTVNNNADAVAELQTLYEELRTYVDDYFTGLDVQKEINNKLDAMVEAGTLQEIIADYLNSKAIFGYNNVASMKQATNLIDGSYAQTLGYYSKNDDGASLYKIRNKTVNDIVNEMDLIEINENLVAELVINNQTINIKQFGVKGDGITDETNLLNYVFSLNSNKVKKIYLNGKYLISDTINISSNKDIIGIKSNLQYNENFDTMILTNNDITMLNLNEQSNIHIANINLKHPVTNRSSVVNFSKSRYIKLENIQVYHDTNTKANCIAFNDTINESSTGFSGYIEFKNVRASYYDISVKSKATLIDFKNCVFNNANTVNIYFLGEVCGIENCDISYSTTGKAIKTESIYNLNIINSYFEGFYIDRCFEKTNNININLKGSKIYIPKGIASANGQRLEVTDEYPQPLRNVLNSYQNGNPSNINLVPNGKFDKGMFGWTYQALTDISIINKDNIGDIGIPHYIQNALRIENGNIRVDINEKLNVGDYVTIGYWVYIPDTSVSNPYITVVDQSNKNGIISDRPSQRNKWVYHTTYAKINEHLTNGLRLRIAYSEIMYITGITFMKGNATTIDSEYTPNANNVVTDNLIFKGTDAKYYKVNYDGTNLTFTETNTI